MEIVINHDQILSITFGCSGKYPKFAPKLWTFTHLYLFSLEFQTAKSICYGFRFKYLSN